MFQHVEHGAVRLGTCCQARGLGLGVVLCHHGQRASRFRFAAPYSGGNDLESAYAASANRRGGEINLLRELNRTLLESRAFL